jgi:glycolate oxidase FAD binding subunit
MVAGAREGTPADAVLGIVPRLVLEPATVEEAAEAMRACARDRLRLLFVGGGTELELGRPPAALDAVLRTGRLARVVEHAPSDQIAVVEAGARLSDLQRRLSLHRQRVALDPPLSEAATLGGVVAANAFGPRRHRFGSARDLVVGVGFVRADGTPAKGGGKVVKNVAGFDVPRLLVGSLGTLALLSTVTVRLHPLPEAEGTVLLPDLDAAAVRQVAIALSAEQLEPSSVAAVMEGGRFRLGIRFEGFAPGVAEQDRRALALAERLGRRAEPLDDGAARAFWSLHDAVRGEGPLRAKISAPPAALAEVERAALAPLLSTLPGGAAAAYPTLGFCFVSGRAADADAAARALEGARAALARLGGTLVLCAAPAEVRELVDPWGPPPPAVEVMRRVKARLDPEGRLAPGRFVGGI